MTPRGAVPHMSIYACAAGLATAVQRTKATPPTALAIGRPGRDGVNGGRAGETHLLRGIALAAPGRKLTLRTRSLFRKHVSEDRYTSPAARSLRAEAGIVRQRGRGRGRGRHRDLAGHVDS